MNLQAFFPRWSYWLSLERYCVAISVFFGAFILFNHSFEVSTSASFRAISEAVRVVPGPPELPFSLALFLSAVLQVIGMARGNVPLRMFAPLLAAGVFLSVVVSSVLNNPHSTGVAAYLCLTGLYLMLTFRRSFGTEWVPLR